MQTPEAAQQGRSRQRRATFMVRKLNHRFKNFLTMSSSVCNAVMMCHRERYGHKMAFAARF
ncbi:hypothetical protein SY86_21985 [Erwinia tracheiphila]|uniref:Uncharacterized protein n=1 Tax=Erwinia tracheiphila TaxID=65700 RepID=A0A0M2KDM9_9GAMM|nr:hypothetical protein SY86_21985 [Erwinia tracheiphila]